MIAKFEVDVTQEDIELGQRSIRNLDNRCARCAVARAVQRVTGLKKAEWAYDSGDVYDHFKAKRLTHSLAASDKDKVIVGRFVTRHDRLEEVKPFSFTLEVEPAK